MRPRGGVCSCQPLSTQHEACVNRQNIFHANPHWWERGGGPTTPACCLLCGIRLGDARFHRRRQPRRLPPPPRGRQSTLPQFPEHAHRVRKKPWGGGEGLEWGGTAGPLCSQEGITSNLSAKTKPQCHSESLKHSFPLLGLSCCSKRKPIPHPDLQRAPLRDRPP